MNIHQRTKIYQIKSHTTDKIYIDSSTKKYLSQRYHDHLSQYKNWKQDDMTKKKYKESPLFKLFDSYGPNNFFIELIETYPCNSKEEANKRVSYYVSSNVNCVNILNYESDEFDIHEYEITLIKKQIKSRIDEPSLDTREQTIDDIIDLTLDLLKALKKSDYIFNLI